MFRLARWFHYSWVLLMVCFARRGRKVFVASNSLTRETRTLIFSKKFFKGIASWDLQKISFDDASILYGKFQPVFIRAELLDKLREYAPPLIEDALNGRESLNGRGYNYLILLERLPRILWREFGLGRLFDKIGENQIRAHLDRRAYPTSS